MGNCLPCFGKSKVEDPKDGVTASETQSLEDLSFSLRSSTEKYDREEEPKPTRRLEKLIISPTLIDEISTTQSEVADTVTLRANVLRGTEVLSRPKFIVEDLFTTSTCTMYEIESIKNEVADSNYVEIEPSQSDTTERERRSLVISRWIRRRLATYARKFVSSLSVDDPESWTQ
ncbi:unnamed protein product [Rodentolepis nana]|uniref:Uncharacterized protein n=1 Tax=Rodentolepis nana TaxID=102285 RepID=A0A0R3TD58_RODNA|nr:unnamed protein product [Rodentolepis nana]